MTLPFDGFGVLFVILDSFGFEYQAPIGKLLGQVAAHWKIAVWALAINFVVIPLVFIGYLLTIASSISRKMRRLSVAALCAGMPSLRCSPSQMQCFFLQEQQRLVLSLIFLKLSLVLLICTPTAC